MHIERNTSSSFAENSLPDGSRVIVDRENEKVYALNSTAGAAWDACSNPTTLSAVTQSMQRSIGPAVTEDVAESAILQLQEQSLVSTTQPAGRKAPTRRQLIMGLSAVAIPLVVSLTMADQKAHAERARSICNDPPPPPPKQCGLICKVLKDL
jgi:hypothetical protein